VASGQRAESVVLQLEDPFGIAERPRAHLGEHRLDLFGVDLLPRRARRAQRLAHLRGPCLGREHRVIGKASAALDERVSRLLDQQPLLAAHPQQRPRAAQLVSAQIEEELAGAKALLHVLHGRAAAAVPRLAGVAPAGGDLHRVPALGGIGRRCLRQRPGPQNAIGFQMETIAVPAALAANDGDAPARPLVQEVWHGRRHVIIARMSARSIGSGTISFGLVSIPVKLFSATQSQAAISFNLLHSKCKGRRKQQYISPRDENMIVERNDMVKGYELGKDQYVTFTTEELKALEEKASQQIEISEFVPTDKIDPVYFDKAYYLGPEKGAD